MTRKEKDFEDSSSDARRPLTRVLFALLPVGIAGDRQGFRRWSSSFSLLTGLQMHRNKLKLELQLWLRLRPIGLPTTGFFLRAPFRVFCVFRGSS